MNRRTFLALLARSGAAPGLGPLVSACGGVDLGRYDGIDTTFDGHVTIIGAGAAGLAADFDDTRAAALSRVNMPPGMKAFFRCSRRFYPDLMTDGRLLQTGTFDRLYYDAAFRKDTSDHVLGFFFVADRADTITSLADAEIAESLVADIGVRFGARAADTIEDVVVKNRVAEPWIRGAYSVDIRGDYDRTIRALRRPIDDRMFFVGEVFGGDDQATVHGAMFSGYDTVVDVLTRT